MVIGMQYPCDHSYEGHKVLQTSGEVCVPLFLGVGTLMVMKICSGTIGYVFNDMDTLNMIMLNPLRSLNPYCIIMMIFLKKSFFPLDRWCWGP